MNVLYTKILERISPEDFKIPLSQDQGGYFPEYIESQLMKFVKIYEEKFVPLIDEGVTFSSGKKDVIVSRIKILCDAIIKSVNHFYKGEILSATQEFNEAMNKVFFKDLSVLHSIKIIEQTSFYRARVADGYKYERSDLFHINFNLRHIVSTNRYSIPGFPALYLGDTSYICWEEFNQPDLKNLNFSLFKNTKELNIIQLLRIEDLLNQIDDSNENIAYLLTYFTFFPLTLACSIKVEHTEANFKPEYIIPQLLLQFISHSKEYDGLKYISSKIDYSKLHNMTTYNYVFPVKTVKKDGYCDTLGDLFHCTQPTSLTLEEIVDNPSATPHRMGRPSDERKIELIEDLKSSYTRTSFGKLENYLAKREIKKI